MSVWRENLETAVNRQWRHLLEAPKVKDLFISLHTAVQMLQNFSQERVFLILKSPQLLLLGWEVEDTEIIFRNDFPWNPVIIARANFLRAREGDTGYFPAPKTFCKQDMELANDTPFLETADAPLVPVKGTSIDRANPNMMDVRWRMFHFWHQIPQAEQPNLISCGHCFAKFILDRTTGS